MFQDCVSTQNLRDLRWWQLRWLVQTIGLDDIEEAFVKMGRGEVLRSVVTL